jgi:predicted transcriptional regulator
LQWLLDVKGQSMKVLRIGLASQEMSRTLKTISRYGLVTMEKNDRSVRPITRAQSYQIMA